MLKVGTIVFLAALAAPATIPSQHPAPSTSEQRGTEQKPTQSWNARRASDDKGTENRPFVVEAHTAPQSQAEAERDAAYQAQRAANDRIFWVGIASIIIGILQTLALVITFLVIAFVAVRQLRAYVYPGTTWIKTFRTPGPVVIVVEMKNSGKTPARKFECHGNAFLGALPLTDETLQEPKEDETGTHSVGTLYPNEEPYTVEFECIDQLVPQAVAELKKQNPEAAIYVVGEIRYRDIFGLKRRTSFCRFIEPEDAVWLITVWEGTAHHIPDRIIRFTTAHIHNEFE